MDLIRFLLLLSFTVWHFSSEQKFRIPINKTSHPLPSAIREESLYFFASLLALVSFSKGERDQKKVLLPPIPPLKTLRHLPVFDFPPLLLAMRPQLALDPDPDPDDDDVRRWDQHSNQPSKRPINDLNRDSEVACSDG